MIRLCYISQEKMPELILTILTSSATQKQGRGGLLHRYHPKHIVWKQLAVTLIHFYEPWFCFLPISVHFGKLCFFLILTKNHLITHYQRTVHATQH